MRERVGSDGAGVTMLLKDGVVYGCANPFTAAIDEIQYRLVQGPCVTATTTHHVVRSTTIATTEQRWPRFVLEAAPRALRSVVSIPLVAGATAIGSLNLYSQGHDGLEDCDDEEARSLADRVMPTVRNLRLITIAANNARALREGH